MKEENNFDVIVIGGGPSGMMAAIRASQKRIKVALLEKNFKLGTKLLLTGGGRCNISHKEDNNKSFSSEFGREGDFLLSPLSIFGPKETAAFFEENGLQLKTEEDNNIFPRTDKAKDVLDLLLSLLKKNNVKIMTGAEVLNIEHKNRGITKIALADGKELRAKNYVLSVGGKSYPVTGSKGDGFVWAKAMGHTVIPPKPALAPIEIKEKWIKNLQGMSFKNAKASVIQAGKVKYEGIGEIIMTHFGLSGPLILNASRLIGDLIEIDRVKVILDLLPDRTEDGLERDVQKLVDKNKNKLLENVLKEILPEKIIPQIIFFSGIKAGQHGFDLTKEDRKKLCKVIKKIELNVIGLMGFDRAMATHGGVSLKEIDSKNMKSKIIDNLYFAGEIINLDGPCGGYNLQMCWTTGYVAGESAAISSNLTRGY